jgi:hypothetical protein
LVTTATDLPLGIPDGYDNEYGHGLVDAEAAYEAVLAIMPGTVSPAPSSSSAAPSNTPSVSSAPSSAPSNFCPTGTIDTTIEITTDYWAYETSWDIKDADDIVVASRASFPSSFTTYEDRVCLSETETCGGSDYTFTIYDSFGDGICCGGWGEGSYIVTVEGEIHADDPFRKGFSFSTSLCHLSCSTYGSENECNEVDTRNCYWNSKGSECHGCSAISVTPFPRFHKQKCRYYGCTWTGNSCV